MAYFDRLENVVGQRRLATAAVMSLILLSSFVAKADTLKGRIEEKGPLSGNLRTAGDAGQKKTLPYYVEGRVIARPTKFGNDAQEPYYPAIDKDSQTGAPWRDWYGRICWDILNNFDKNVDEPCSLLLNVSITSDHKIKADYIGDSRESTAVQRTLRTIDSLSGNSHLVFPSDSTRQSVWMQIRLTRGPGSNPPTVDPPDSLWSYATIHPEKTLPK